MLIPIRGNDGYYIDDQGNVYSEWVNKGIHGLVRSKSLRKLKGSKHKHGYTMFRFKRNGKAHLLHRLVIESFVGPIPEGMVVCHKNDIPSDNRLDNLYIGTQRQNMSDSIKLNRFPSGYKNGQSKLSQNDVRKIRRIKELNPELPNRVIAGRFGVSRKVIDLILKGATYKNVI
ncbi:HNH endonuclease signature motif containing protein [Shouchella lehensis]|uniref:HNH endonuclease n=1 Tax=Shouchella lehensis TaxID=300825 RepID=A0A4Y7WIZ7_9BACI|nr:HNH endonuclease signature motif containing protein [Shouchella lehensis]TES48061.1 HNH endonuclease [Shouchella lehensis]